MMTLWRHIGDGALPRQVENWKLICNFLEVSLRNLQRPLRLQGWHLDDALENPGVGRLSRRVETWKLICSFLDVYFRHPQSQRPPRLLSGTSSILLDSMMTLWRHIWDGALPRKVEIWKLICSFLDVFLRHPLDQKLPKILSGTTSILLDSKDDTWMTLWRTQELEHFPGRYRIENLYAASLMYPWVIHYVKNHQNSSQEPPASS